MENLETILQDKRVKLTPAQKVISKKLLSGYKIIIVNQHRANGGELMWIEDENVNSIFYAGRVYKAFFGLERSIKKVYPEFKIADYMSKNNNVRY